MVSSDGGQLLMRPGGGLFQCLNRQMVSSDIRSAGRSDISSKFQCLNRQMVSSDITGGGRTSGLACFNASIGRWCLQTPPVQMVAATNSGFNASIGRWCLQTRLSSAIVT